MSTYTDASTSNYVTVNAPGLENFKLHYNDSGSGPAIVMLHGGGPGASGWSNFYKNVDFFVEAGYRVLLLDCPGFNKSGEIVSDVIRPLLNARAVKALLDALNIEKAHLVGNSLGGATALHFALEFPDSLDRLVLMGSAGMGNSVVQPNPQEGIRKMIKLYAAPSYENFVDMLDVFVFDPSEISEELRKGRWANIEASPAHLKNFLASNKLAPIPGWDVSHRVNQIKAKTLVIWGRDDRFVPIDNALRLINSLPLSELHVFARCGHWAQWEHAPAFNRLVGSFLAN